jgi:16S rRNA processing protein RimM
VKTQGRHGEVAAELHTDFPERFEQRKQLCALGEDGSRRELRVESFWLHKGQIVLKFAAFDSISAAEALIGCELQIPAADRVQLEHDWVYVSDLVGRTVWDSEREIGKVSDVRFGAGEAPLLVVQGAQQEYEIPFAQTFVEKVDIGANEIRMRLPEGLLEVNAPLTEEEKEQQRESSAVKSQ